MSLRAITLQVLIVLAAVAAALFSPPSLAAEAATAGAALTPSTAPLISIAGAEGEAPYSLTIQVLALMTALTLLPALVLMMSSFTRIIIVLSILRQALGTAQTPPNQVLIGLALFLTFFVMAPVMSTSFEAGLGPYLDGEIAVERKLSTGAWRPSGLSCWIRPGSPELELFVSLSADDVNAPEEVATSVLVPAFITSELKTAFQIGFLVFHPVRDYRSGGGQHPHVHGHDDAVTDAGLSAIQDHVVRAD